MLLWSGWDFDSIAWLLHTCFCVDECMVCTVTLYKLVDVFMHACTYVYSYRHVL